MITGAVLMVASAVFYVGRINAQPINFTKAVKFASTCSLVLAVVGTIFIVWGLIEAFMKTRKD